MDGLITIHTSGDMGDDPQRRPAYSPHRVLRCRGFRSRDPVNSSLRRGELTSVSNEVTVTAEGRGVLPIFFA